MDSPQANRPRRIAVVGGGISGLAAAHELTRQARADQRPLEVLLIEASPRLGGTVRTHTRDNFLLEGGPDAFISEKPEALELAHQLGLESRLLETNAAHRRSFIVRGGRLRPVPEGFHLLAPSRFRPFVSTDIFTWAGKARMALDLLLPRRAAARAVGETVDGSDDPGGDDESLAAFVRRRFGREALERMAQPMVGGIYTADPEQLSLRATMPRFLDMERKDRSIILAMWRARRRAATDTRGTSGARYSLFLSFDGGMQTLTDALAAALPRGTARTGTSVEAIDFNHETRRWNLRVRASETNNNAAGGHDTAGMDEAARDGERMTGCPGAWRAAGGDGAWRDAGVDAAGRAAGGDGARVEGNDARVAGRDGARAVGEIIAVDGLCLALPAYASARLLGGIDSELAAELEGIPYASTATVNLAFRRADIPHALDGFGFVVPFVERRRTLACTFSSVKFAGRAPAGHALLRAFVGGALQPEMYALDEAEMLASVRADLRALLGIERAPLFAHVERWPRSMAQYHLGHLARVARIRRRLQRFPTLQLAGNAYGGAGIPDCIRSGRAAAKEILEEKR
ncbi:MAG TPA: protoporphyrinogen oxidase [Pyrinomonadaceae bacterium]|nr:protoporphyrinogen oxidase [Pyrinomonadaceae bacterium]